MNLAEVFFARARRQPDHAAVIRRRPAEHISYGELARAVRRQSDALRRGGLRRGGCVALQLPSGLPTIINTYAAWACGACVVPIALEMSRRERQELLRTIALDQLICPSGDLPRLATEPQQTTPLEGGLTQVTLQREIDHPQGFAALDPAFVRFSSGTTGRSKGVVLSHATVFDRIHAANEVLAISHEDRIVWLLSMAHHFTVSIVAYLSFGATILLCENHFGATIIDVAREGRGTLIYGSPLHYTLMCNAANAGTIESLRLAISTTTALEAKTREAFQARYGLPLSQALGIIEVGLPCIDIAPSAERPLSVGRPLPAYELRLEECGLGRSHRAIKLRGMGFFDAYYSPWQTRQQVMPDGFFATGDLGELDEQGYLTIRGRSKDVINVGGMKVFPQEVERVLREHPAVSECCVYPHPHGLLGEVPHARVVLKTSAPEASEGALKRHIGAHLASFKLPERILFVEALEKTFTGKLIRDESRMRASI